MSTFTWVPDNGFSNEPVIAVTKVKFGDGYEQRGTFGINNIIDKYPLTFNNRDQSEADAIEAFLISNAGVQSFDWTPPNATTSKKFKCEIWKKIHVKGTLYSVTATFEQVF